MKKLYIFSIIALLIFVTVFRIFQNEKDRQVPEEIVYSQEIQKRMEIFEKIKEQANINALKPKIPKTFENVIPYTEELPPVPDQKLNNSTLFGIDFNNNGVRDDLEHWIVKEFGKDKMVVEGFFAYVRSDMLDMQILEEGLFTDDLYENDIRKRTKLATGCRSKYFYSSAYEEEKRILYLISQDFGELIFNTKERKKNAKEFFHLLNNRFFTMGPVTDKECKEFFEKTKLYQY